MQPTQQELLSLLWQGVEIWNQQRPRVSMEVLRSIHWDDFDEYAYALSWVDLSGVDLSGADLHQVDLSYSRLDGAQLREANLSGANLASASVARADLFGVNFKGANLNCVFLMEANLENADLRDANLLTAHFQFANLHGANLSSVDLRGGSLAHADLSEADLAGANLARVELDHAHGVAMDALKRQRYYWTQEELLTQIAQAQKLAVMVEQSEPGKQQDDLKELRDKAFRRTVNLMKLAESLRYLDKEELKMLQDRVNELEPGMWDRYRMHPRWRYGDPLV